MLSSFSRPIVAGIIIFGTTVDDTVWLTPFIASESLSLQIRIFHGLLFIVTLELLTCFCVLIASGIELSIPLLGNIDSDCSDVLLGLVSAILCWIVAAYFFMKYMRKKRRKTSKLQNMTTIPADKILPQAESHSYGAVDSFTSDRSMFDGDSTVELVPRDRYKQASPWTVISLTIIGALDELSYFPSLLTGRVFSPRQMYVGTLLASIFVLVIVSVFLAKCKRLIDFLDSIPLYTIVTVFSVILTVDVFYHGIEIEKC